jgi:hypothetical protein
MCLSNRNEKKSSLLEQTMSSTCVSSSIWYDVFGGPPSSFRKNYECRKEFQRHATSQNALIFMIAGLGLVGLGFKKSKNVSIPGAFSAAGLLYLIGVNKEAEMAKKSSAPPPQVPSPPQPQQQSTKRRRSPTPSNYYRFNGREGRKFVHRNATPWLSREKHQELYGN